MLRLWSRAVLRGPASRSFRSCSGAFVWKDSDLEEPEDPVSRVRRLKSEMERSSRPRLFEEIRQKRMHQIYTEIWDKLLLSNTNFKQLKILPFQFKLDPECHEFHIVMLWSYGSPLDDEKKQAIEKTLNKVYAPQFKHAIVNHMYFKRGPEVKFEHHLSRNKDIRSLQRQVKQMQFNRPKRR